MECYDAGRFVRYRYPKIQSHENEKRGIIPVEKRGNYT
jgi:hypothetical protein